VREITRDIAGGLILSADGKVLLGQNVKGGVHDDKWVIPGGGIDEGESQADALKREMLEEIGLDISDGQITPFEVAFTGSAEKTLRETGERVMVNMTFYDSVIRLAQNAEDISLRCEDDFDKARFFSKEELSGLLIAPFTLRRLEEAGLIQARE
jgi:8-oxo-dGTP pyrophosphatase MutT (NUDIX family)